MGLLANAAHPLTTPTDDGSGQAVHPCVIDFYAEHQIDEWCGYRYWMVVTPYPEANSAYENPNLLASADGIDWVVPVGIVNPIRTITAPSATHYQSDPCMLYDPTNNRLVIYYRESVYHDPYQVGDYTTHLVQYLASDLTLSEVAPMRVRTNGEFADWTVQQYADIERSLAVVRVSATEWHAWTSKTVGSAYLMFHRASANGVDWEEAEACGNPLGAWPTYYSWHQSCKYDRTANRVEFLHAANTWANPQRRLIVTTHTTIAAPTVFAASWSRWLIEPSLTGWDSASLYTASFTVSSSGDARTYRVWYSGISASGAYRIGYTEGLVTMSAPIPDQEYRVQHDGTLADRHSGISATIIGNGGVLPNIRPFSAIGGVTGFIGDLTNEVAVSVPTTGWPSSEGTIVAIAGPAGGATALVLMQWDDGTDNNRIYMYSSSGTAGNTAVVKNPSVATVANAPHSIERTWAMRWKTGTKLAINRAGTKYESDTDTITPSGLGATCYVGSKRGESIQYNGSLHLFAHFDRSLTDEELGNYIARVKNGPVGASARLIAMSMI